MPLVQNSGEVNEWIARQRKSKLMSNYREEFLKEQICPILYERFRSHLISVGCDWKFAIIVVLHVVVRIHSVGLLFCHAIWQKYRGHARYGTVQLKVMQFISRGDLVVDIISR